MKRADHVVRLALLCLVALTLTGAGQWAPPLYVAEVAAHADAAASYDTNVPSVDDATPTTTRWPAAYGPGAAQVWFFGDSQTAGTGPTVPPNNLSTVTAGLLGVPATRWGQTASPGWSIQDNLLAAYNAGMNAEHRTRAVAVLWIGTNDLEHAYSVAGTWASEQVIGRGLRAYGWWVLLLNPLPRTSGESPSYATDAAALRVLQSACAGDSCDAYYDVASQFPDPATYADGTTHLTAPQVVTLSTSLAAIITPHI